MPQAIEQVTPAAQAAANAAGDAAKTDWMSEATVATFAGSVLLVSVISAAIRRVSGWNSLGIPFVLSLLVSFIVASAKGGLSSPLGWLVAAGNGCLLFFAAIGSNEFVVNAAAAKPAGKSEVQAGPAKKKLLLSYFRRSN